MACAAKLSTGDDRIFGRGIARSFIHTDIEQKLKADTTFAKNPQERLQRFYQRTPVFDSEWDLYPLAREVK